MPYKTLEKICEFCLKPYVGTKRTKSCKSCLGVSSRYARLDSSINKHDFYTSKRPVIIYDGINIEKTIIKFGHDPTTLPPFSSKKIFVVCDICNTEFVASMAKIGYGSFHCAKCNGKAANLRKYDNLEDEKIRFFDDAKLAFVDTASTKQKFGYDPADLTFQSNKPVVRICGFCQERSVTKFDKFTDSCKKCSVLSSLFKKQSVVTSRHEFYKQYRPDIPFSQINVNKTRVSFGYDPRKISPYSSNKIYTRCHYCSVELITRMHIFTRSGFKITCKKCVSKKNLETLKNKYGVNSTLDIPGVQEKLSNPMTEQIIEAILLNTYKVPFIRHFKVNGPSFDYEFDFHIPSCNLLIECHGDYFHKFKENGYSGTPKDKAKSTYIEKYTSYKLIWIWEHELHMGRIRKILDFHIHGVLEPKINVNLKDVEFTKITNDIAYKFLSQYHYLGNLGTAANCFGAYADNNLIAVCVFGGPTRQTSLAKMNNALHLQVQANFFKELRRFCIRPNVEAKNLASYCLKRFIKTYQHETPVELIVSFADSTVEDRGTIYRASNWINIGSTDKSYHYLDPSTNKDLHKKTVWDHASKIHMKESDFATKCGLVKINELPKSIWVKQLI